MIAAPAICSPAVGLRAPSVRSTSFAAASASPLRLASRAPAAIRSSRRAFVCRAGKIDVNFVTAEGTKTVKCAPGAVLRDVMLDNEVELYTTWGKVWSCGGYGQCGTCTVNVTGGMDLLPAEKSQPEEKHLKKKPDTWRLACQCLVGEGAEEGTLTIENLPQKK